MDDERAPWDDAHEDEDDDAPPQEEPEGWREAVNCPMCGSDEARLTERRHEVSVYLCERCNTSFEVE